MKKIKKFVLNNKLLILILLLGLGLRLFKYEQLFYYSHDQDLSGWFIRDVLENHHLRLIGQETSQHGVFIGPLFYYSLIPFYLLFGMDPIGGILLPIFIAAISILSVYFVFSKIWGKTTGLVGSFIYAVSFNILFTDREVVPTTPAMLWTIWFLYALYLIKQGQQKYGFLLSAILIGLVWHINLALVLTAPLLVLAFIFSKKKLDFKWFLISIFLCLVVNVPFLLFELKHNFQQINAIFGSVAGEPAVKLVFAEKLARTMELTYKNTTAIFFGPEMITVSYLTFAGLIIAAIYLWFKKVLSSFWILSFLLWGVTFIVFFSLNAINLSEYYLNGINIVWISIAAVFVGYLLKLKNTKWIGFGLLVLLFIATLYRLDRVVINESGYLQRKAIAEFIKKDSQEHDYPCVSVSYITSPGNNFGYRYMFYLAELDVRQPSSLAPVYSIVFPLEIVDGFDMSFGDIGLVLPDYNRYNKESIQTSCAGPNANLTDPMFGFTN